MMGVVWNKACEQKSRKNIFNNDSSVSRKAGNYVLLAVAPSASTQQRLIDKPENSATTLQASPPLLPKPSVTDEIPIDPELNPTTR